MHRAKLRAEEVTTKDGIRVTTPARTILDRAGVVARRELERTLDEAAYLGLDLSELAPRQGRRGSALLAAVQAEHDAGSTRTRSEVEERMLALCRRFRLPTPEVNRKVESYTADFLWRHARLIVETDGWQGHGHREAFERDRVRDAALTVAGWRVMRVTWRRLTRDPGRVAAQLGRLL